LPKYGSERAVPMPEELAAILRRHEDLGHLTEWMFAGAEPDPPHQNTVGARWRATLKRAELDGIRLHDLRHFYASGLIADGCDVVTVQRALGHAKASHHAGHLRQALALQAGTAPGGPPRASLGSARRKCGRDAGKRAVMPSDRASTLEAEPRPLIDEPGS
jgi:integrase